MRGDGGKTTPCLKLVRVILEFCIEILYRNTETYLVSVNILYSARIHYIHFIIIGVFFQSDMRAVLKIFKVPFLPNNRSLLMNTNRPEGARDYYQL